MLLKEYKGSEALSLKRGETTENEEFSEIKGNLRFLIVCLLRSEDISVFF